MQAAIAKAQPHLPSEMPAPPSYRKFNPADAPVVLIAFRSDSEPLEHLDDMLRRTVIPALSGLDGVAHVGVAGSRKRAIRIQVDPYSSVAKGLGIDLLARAITGANDDAPLGEVRGAASAFLSLPTPSSGMQPLSLNSSSLPRAVGRSASETWPGFTSWWKTSRARRISTASLPWLLPSTGGSTPTPWKWQISYISSPRAPR